MTVGAIYNIIAGDLLYSVRSSANFPAKQRDLSGRLLLPFFSSFVGCLCARNSRQNVKYASLAPSAVPRNNSRKPFVVRRHKAPAPFVVAFWRRLSTAPISNGYITTYRPTQTLLSLASTTETLSHTCTSSASRWGRSPLSPVVAQFLSSL